MRVPANLVSPRARWYWAVRALVVWLLVVAVEVVIWLADPHSGGHAVVLAVTLALAAAHLIVMPQWRYRVHRWETADTAVSTQAAWFRQERRIAPISRVQTADTQRGPFEQLFGLANVTVTTASAAGPLKIHGLDDAVVLAGELTVRTAIAGGDGT